MGTRVTAETCPHYLMLSEEDIPTLGSRGKINPPLRPAVERDALWPLLRRGLIHSVSSDHAPWPLHRKEHPNIFQNASGAPGVEVLLPLMYSEGVARGRLAITDLARLLAENPARIFGLWGRKGAIAPGFDADLVVIDPEAEWVLGEAQQHSHAGWSPYHHWRLRGRIELTLLRGRPIYRNSQILAEPGTGRFLEPLHPALEPSIPVGGGMSRWNG